MTKVQLHLVLGIFGKLDATLAARASNLVAVVAAVVDVVLSAAEMNNPDNNVHRFYAVAAVVAVASGKTVTTCDHSRMDDTNVVC